MENGSLQPLDIQARAQQILLEVKQISQKMQQAQDWRSEQNRLLSEFLGGESTPSSTPAPGPESLPGTGSLPVGYGEGPAPSPASVSAVTAALLAAPLLASPQMQPRTLEAGPAAACDSPAPTPAAAAPANGGGTRSQPLKTSDSALPPSNISREDATGSLMDVFTDSDAISEEQIKARSKQILASVKQEVAPDDETWRQEHSKLIQDLLSQTSEDYMAASNSTNSRIPSSSEGGPTTFMLPRPQPQIMLQVPIDLALPSNLTSEELAEIQARGQEILKSVNSSANAEKAASDQSAAETSQLVDDFLSASAPSPAPAPAPPTRSKQSKQDGGEFFGPSAPGPPSTSFDLKTILRLLSQLLAPMDNMTQEERAAIAARSQELLADAAHRPLNDIERQALLNDLMGTKKQTDAFLPPRIAPMGEWQKLSKELTRQVDPESTGSLQSSHKKPLQEISSQSLQQSEKGGTRKRKGDLSDLTSACNLFDPLDNEERKKRYKAIYSLLRPEKGIHTRDPDAPKRPLNAYNIFFKETRGKLKAESTESNSKFKKHQLAHHVAQLWRSLPLEEKMQYEEQAEANRIRYDKEMKEYENRLQINKPDILKPCTIEAKVREKHQKLPYVPNHAAYNAFIDEERRRLSIDPKTSNLPMDVIGKIISHRWQELSEEKLNCFIEKSVNAKAKEACNLQVQDYVI